MFNDYNIDSDENSDYIYNTIDRIIKEVGPRAPCSEAERKGSEWVKNELDKFCDNTEMEDFYCRPKAFLGFLRVCIILFAISVAIFLFSPINPIIFSLICLGIGIFIVLIFWEHFFCYKEFLWPLFKKKRSQNVIGTIKPTETIKNRIIFSGHIDSAFRFNLIHYLKHLYAYFLISSIVVIIAFLPIYFFQLINGITEEQTIFNTFYKAIIGEQMNFFTYFRFIILLALPAVYVIFIVILGKKTNILWGALHLMEFSNILIIISITAYCYIVDLIFLVIIGLKLDIINLAMMLFINWLPSIIALFFFVSGKATPGAVDNLTGVAISLCIAKILHEWKELNLGIFPKNTEVQIVIVGCEEAGLRGSEAFARKHSAEYNKIDTTCVNLESITDSKALHFFTKEDTTRTKLDLKIVNDLAKTSKEMKINYKVLTMPSLSGGTDAAGFEKGGLRATSIEGIIWEDYLMYYHSDRDTIDIINKERRSCDDYGTKWNNRNIRCALENALKVSLGYLRLIENR